MKFKKPTFPPLKFKKPSFYGLLTPILIVGILMFAGLVVYISLSAYQREQKHIEQYTHAQMKNLILDLETKLMSIDAALSAESHRTHVSLADSTMIFNNLEKMIADLPYIHYAGLEIWDESLPDTLSTVLYVYQEPNGDLRHTCANVFNRDCNPLLLDCFYRAEMSGKPTWSYPYPDSLVNHAVVITCYMKVENKLAMFYTDVDMNVLLKTIDSMQFYPNSQMYIQVPSGETYSLDEGNMLSVNTIDVDEKDYIQIPAHYRHLDIDIINVVPKEVIYNSMWEDIFIVLLIFIVALTLLAVLVHRSFVKAQANLASSIAKAQEEQMALKRIEDEISIAARIQKRMLIAPGKSAHFAPTDGEKVDLMSQIIPAREVGGDLYEYRLEGNNLVVCIGDVSGKGVPASMEMAMCSTLFHAYVSDTANPNPSELLSYLNHQLCRRNNEMMFVTVWVGVLDLATGQLKYSSAGHNPPILVRNGEARFLELCQGVPLAMFEESSYPMSECYLQVHDALMLYTDGITEAEGLGCQLFGDERLLESCRKSHTTCPVLLCRSVLRAVAQHAAGCKQSDDITLLCFSYGEHFAQIHGIEDIKAIHTLVAECGASDEAALVIEEAAVNTLTHGGATFACVEYRDGVFILTSDGDDFDPTAYQVPEMKEGEIRVSGRGIPLTRMLCSEITYQRTSDGLSVLRFKINSESSQ